MKIGGWGRYDRRKKKRRESKEIRKERGERSVLKRGARERRRR